MPIRPLMRTVLLLGALLLSAVPAAVRASEPPDGPAAFQFLHLWGDLPWAEEARVAVGGSGNIFLAGTTTSADWPAAWSHGCALMPQQPCSHVFIEKLTPGGGHLFYRVQLGGSREDHLTGIAVDRAGNAYVTGTTTSPDFPTVHALQRHCAGPAGGCADAFVAKISPRGLVIYSTYLGGSGRDGANGIAVDRWGAVYVAGSTASRDFPTAHAAQRRLRGGTDAFVTKLAPSGKRLVYSTYYGGARDDGATSIAVTPDGTSFVAGNTLSPGLRLSPGAVGRRFLGGSCIFYPCMDTFVASFGGRGRFLSGTYLATAANDSAYAIALDPWNNVYVAGATGARDFPSHEGTVTNGKAFCGDEGDLLSCESAFVVGLTSSLDRVLSSRMLSGNGRDEARAMSIDSHGYIALGGYTESRSFPTVNAVQWASNGGHCSAGRGGVVPCDGFLTVLAPHNDSILFSTYVGGDEMDAIQSVALDGRGAVVFAGQTWSHSMPPSPDVFTAVQGHVLFGKIDRAY